MADAPIEPRADPAVRRALAALGCRNADELAIGGRTAVDLADQFGTPLYVYDAHVLAERTATVRTALGPRVQLLYSLKANPSLALTARLRELGLGAEIASLGELKVAMVAGHPAGALRFAGPAKTDAEIHQALERGLGCFHAESASEVDAISAAAAQQGAIAGVAVRVNLPDQLAGARLRMGGASSRFGVDAADVPPLLRRIAADAALELRGLHVYSGTQCFDPEAFAAHARALAGYATTWEQELSVPLPELDVGGGFAEAMYTGDPLFDVDAAGRGLQELVEADEHRHRTFLVELGRYLVAPAGVYLTRVVRRKNSGGMAQIALDGGLHHCAAATGSGTVLKRPPLLVHATALRRRAEETVALGGPLCTPQDQFAAAVRMPTCREGDLIAVLNVGAYGRTFSPVRFLSHPEPAEVLVQDGLPRVVRRRGAPGDALFGQER